MRTILIAVLTCVVRALVSPLDATDEERRHNWAVLVAGGQGWNSYRYQADVCHAYQLLRRHGVPASNIITMMADDISQDPRNPFPGQVFNDYSHTNVHEGVQVDYKGENVTKEHFIGVLMAGQSLKQQGHKVLASGPKDNVFLFLSVPGNRSSIEFVGGKMSAEELYRVLRYLYSHWLYDKMLIYLDGNYAGSMFDNSLSEYLQIFAVTSAGREEQNFQAFCNDSSFDFCLANEFSHNWITDTEEYLSAHRTVEQQYLAVSAKMKGSTLTTYGDQQIKYALVRDFQSGTPTESMKTEQPHSVVEQTMADIMALLRRTRKPTYRNSAAVDYIRCLEYGSELVQRKCFSKQQVTSVMEHRPLMINMCKLGYSVADVIECILEVCA